jgi:abequosyltransferase
MNPTPKLTVCIPAYNRARFLAPLLDSIFAENYHDFDVLICEDNSPERGDIAKIVKRFTTMFPGRIQYHENDVNLGYDANMRQLINLANGEYCVFMGNDDLLCKNALSIISDIIDQNENCGVIVRSYASFDANPLKPKQVFRYFPSELTISPGAQAISIAFRRSVVIPGMVLHRKSAVKLSTNEFDGSLLYQLYLVGRILSERSVVFTPEIIALRRDGIPPDFGNSEIEQSKFVPNDQTPDSSIHFVSEMLRIAKSHEEATGLSVFNTICKDIGTYSYPILAIQASRSKGVFFRYGVALARLGFWRVPLFYVYFFALLVFRPSVIESVIQKIKTHLGYTPLIGSARGNLK